MNQATIPQAGELPQTEETKIAPSGGIPSDRTINRKIPSKDQSWWTIYIERQAHVEGRKSFSKSHFLKRSEILNHPKCDGLPKAALENLFSKSLIKLKIQYSCSHRTLSLVCRIPAAAAAVRRLLRSPRRELPTPRAAPRASDPQVLRVSLPIRMASSRWLTRLFRTRLVRHPPATAPSPSSHHHTPLRSITAEPRASRRPVRAMSAPIHLASNVRVRNARRPQKSYARLREEGTVTSKWLCLVGFSHLLYVKDQIWKCFSFVGTPCNYRCSNHRWSK